MQLATQRRDFEFGALEGAMCAERQEERSEAALAEELQEEVEALQYAVYELEETAAHQDDWWREDGESEIYYEAESGAEEEAAAHDVFREAMYPLSDPGPDAWGRRRSAPTSPPLTSTANPDIMALQGVVQGLATAVAAMAQSQHTMSGQHDKLLSTLTDAAHDAKQTLRPEKPKLTGKDAAVLHEELRVFRVYMNESKIHDKAKWFSGARSIAKDRAHRVLEAFIVSRFGTEAKFQQALADKGSGIDWPAYWSQYEQRLKVESGLDDASELNEAVRNYGKVKLHAKSTAQEVDHFLQDYSAARTKMIEVGLLIPSDPLSRAREIEELRTKTEGSDLLRYMMELPEFPEEVDDAFDPARAKVTFLGRARQYVQARRRSGLSGAAGDSSGRNDKGGDNMNAQFLASTLKQASKQQGLVEATLKKLGGKAPHTTKSSDDAALLNADSLRGAAARNTDGGGNDRDAWKKSFVGGGGSCPKCQGTHPECATCPTTAAEADEKFDVSRAVKEKLPCWYAWQGGKPCGGYGHVSRHHHETLTPENKKIRDEKQKEKGKGGGKNKKGKSKGSKKGGEKRLDMNDSHDSPTQAERQRSARLLEALLVSGDCDRKRGLDFDEDLGKHKILEGRLATERLKGFAFGILFVLLALLSKAMKALRVSAVMLIIFLFIAGLPLVLGESRDEARLYQASQAVRGVAGTNDSGRSAETFLPACFSLPKGYNSRGYCWIGAARNEAVWDTGSTRNGIDKEYLMELIKNDRTSGTVKEIRDISPLSCSSMLASASFTINKMAVITVTFKERSGTRGVSKDLGFVVIDGSSEDLVIGKPTLDELGYVSDKTTIELRTLGLRFSTVLPEECKGTATGIFLRCAENEHIEVPEGQSKEEVVEVLLPKECRSGKWWLQPGPDLPETMQLIEGPLVASRCRCKVSFLVHGNATVGPGTRMVHVRRGTEGDEEVLEAIKKADAERNRGQKTMARVVEQANDDLLTALPPGSRSSAESFLKTSYKTRGKKERQQALFPKLEEEIAADIKAREEGAEWPDQSAETYKDEVQKLADAHIGKQLTKRQRGSFCQRILRAFSICLWLPGCNPPQVTGYRAHIESMPDARPRITQQFPLSPFDQRRLEYHEDVEVAEGKAVWLEHGCAGKWGSPSFVVDQEGKGVLGRPVRDYRYPNSQTLDTMWPSPDANAVLARAQRGAIHSTLDCVWGFTQLPIDEETAELLQLICRRGVLRPTVLFFGAKQGPGLFQGFMDTTFGSLTVENGEKLAAIFMDDVSISTEGYEGDDDDAIVDRHIRHLEIFLQKACAHGVQFKLTKCRWCQEYIKLLGFILGNGTRKVDPKKAQALRDWPEPSSLDDVVSVRAYANFIKEYIPSFHVHDLHLRKYTKKGAKFSEWQGDAVAQQAFRDLRDAVAVDAELHVPDYDAAADPASGRRFELFVDTSDFAWGCTLSQRGPDGGGPRPIAVFSRSLTETEQAWSTFERELFGLRESLAAVEHLIKGFKVVVYTDHKNNLFTGSLLGNRRVNKKLLRWAIDLEEFGDSISRIWLKGSENILGDAPSRNTFDRDTCQRLALPTGPVRRIVDKMFRAPLELDAEIHAMEEFLESLDNLEPDTSRDKKASPTRGDVPATSAVADGGPVPVVSDAKGQVRTEDADDTGASLPGKVARGLEEEVRTTVSEPSAEAAQPVAPLSPPTAVLERSLETDHVKGEEGVEGVAEGGLESSLELSASWPDSLEWEHGNDTSLLHCVGAGSVRHRVGLQLLAPEEETEFRAVSLDTTGLDGVYPRKSLVCFLPAAYEGRGRRGYEDARLPLDVRTLPTKIARVLDGPNEHFYVEYPAKMVCQDGVARRTMWYRCCPKTATPEQRERGRKEAEESAWQHLRRVLEADDSSPNGVDLRFGEGPLTSGGAIVFHGNAHEEHAFCVHPARPNFFAQDIVIWRPARDTLRPARDFCKDARYVRRHVDGTEIWQCDGHDAGSGARREEDWPEEFESQPLRGKRLVEVFSGHPSEGGARLSAAWEAAGGEALRYDTRVDDEHDFLEDHAFWDRHVQEPVEAYHFAFPCNNVSAANSTPKIRTFDMPYGAADDADCQYYNEMAKIMIKRIILLLSKGAMVTVEQPLLSYLYILDEFAELAGFPGLYLFRQDDCMYGTAYRKSRGWLTSCASMTRAAAKICEHAGPHPEWVRGSSSRKSATYPKELVIALVKGVIHELELTGSLTDATAKESAQLYIARRDQRINKKKRSALQDWLERGRKKVYSIRHGALVAGAVENLADEFAKLPPGIVGDDSDERGGAVPDALGSEKSLENCSRVQFERAELRRLQRADHEFRDIIAAAEVAIDMERTGRDVTSDILQAEVKKRISDSSDKNRAKRAAAAVADLAAYQLKDELLHRQVWHDAERSHGLRMVVPEGGRRAFIFNGRKYALTLRKSLLLLYHDSSTMGAHSSAPDTFAKLARDVWWPTLERDTLRWVKTCAVCRITKPQTGMPAEARMELYDRPFRVLFIDALGPISPSDGVYRWIFHAECPFTRYCWLCAAEFNDGATWAKFLCEEVFFDVCGFPMVLRSDRGGAFLSDVIREVNEFLKVDHCFGAAFRPEAQGYIEGRHKTPNNILASFVRGSPHVWARWVKLAQWVMRATPRSDRGDKSPYELVTGLIPQGPVASFIERCESAKLPTDPTSYVAELVANLKTIREDVQHQLEADMAARQAKVNQSRKKLQQGDFVYLMRPPRAMQSYVRAAGVDVSRRILPRCTAQLYRIFKMTGPGSCILQDPDSGSTSLGFSQPVALERLVPYDLCPLEEPISQRRLILELRMPDESWRKAKIVSQNPTGWCRVQFDDDGSTDLVALEREEYRWLE